ncbi:MAG: hypothetical protein PHC68_02635 [Syntrophorhabdaceae bacterium]|nr:hypothetical protein [Syntrophorhabdaceae bacterium]
MSKVLWKSMLTGPKSANGSEGAWKIGEWRKASGELEMCANGYHASLNVIDAMNYVDAEIIARVEVRGKHLDQSDKQCWEQMRITKAWAWTKEDSVRLAICAAELVIGIYEKQHPDDKRPREAIESAKKWLAEPSEKNRAAAEAAARASWAAAGAATEAAWAAGAATEAAWAATEAAWAATEAATEAAWAATEAARADIKARCHRFVLRALKGKEELA